MTQDLLIAPVFPIPQFKLNETARQLKELALDGAALIGKVSNSTENDQSVQAMIELKRISMMFEKSRKAEKEPALEYGRKLDTFFKTEDEPLQKEYGRLSALVGEFAALERQRVAEEQRLQQAELDRIEREKQAELKRLADEQAARELKARQIADEAERLAKAAKTQAERQLAEEMKVTAADVTKAVQAAGIESSRQAEAVEEKAAAATYVESRPVVATKAEGQIVKTDWDIQVVNPYELAKCHPDCVNITPRLSEIKAYLNNGRPLKGIVAIKKITSGVRTVPQRAAIEV